MMSSCPDSSSLQEAAESSLSAALTQAVHSRAQQLLQRDKANSSRGWRRYTEWEQQKWKQQRYEYYEDDMFRCCYAISKLPWSVGISTKALAAVSEVACARRLLLTAGRAVCLGCGPGSDAIALLGLRRCGNPAAPLAVFLVDRCSGWRVLLASADEQLRDSRLPYSLWFKAGCVQDPGAAERLLPDADLVMLSFAHSVNAEPALWTHLAARYSLVLVVDITSDALAASLQLAGYTACSIDSQSTVSVFFHLSAAKAGDVALADGTAASCVEDDSAASVGSAGSSSGQLTPE